MKIVSSPHNVPTISARPDSSSATPIKWADPGGVFTTVVVAATSIARTQSRSTTARREGLLAAADSWSGKA